MAVSCRSRTCRRRENGSLRGYAMLRKRPGRRRSRQKRTGKTARRRKCLLHLVDETPLEQERWSSTTNSFNLCRATMLKRAGGKVVLRSLGMGEAAGSIPAQSILFVFPERFL